MVAASLLIPEASPADTLISAIFSKIDGAVDIYSGPEALFAGLDLLSPGQRAMYAVRSCTVEIFNGGFRQLFFNSTGILAHEALKGYELFEASVHYKVFREAMAIFDGGWVPLVRAQRIEALYASPFVSDLTELSYRFQDIETSDSIEAYVRRYIAAHKAEFFSPA